MMSEQAFEIPKRQNSWTIFSSFINPAKRCFDLSSIMVIVAALLRNQNTPPAHYGLDEDGVARLALPDYELALERISDSEIGWVMTPRTDGATMAEGKRLLVQLLLPCLTIFEPEAMRWCDRNCMIDVEIFRDIFAATPPRRISTEGMVKTRQTPVHKPHGAPEKPKRAGIFTDLIEKRVRRLFTKDAPELEPAEAEPQISAQPSASVA